VTSLKDVHATRLMRLRVSLKDGHSSDLIRSASLLVPTDYRVTCRLSACGTRVGAYEHAVVVHTYFSSEVCVQNKIH
jgi:hypothetical protein